MLSKVWKMMDRPLEDNPYTNAAKVNERYGALAIAYEISALRVMLEPFAKAMRLYLEEDELITDPAEEVWK